MSDNELLGNAMSEVLGLFHEHVNFMDAVLEMARGRDGWSARYTRALPPLPGRKRMRRFTAWGGGPNPEAALLALADDMKHMDVPE